MPRKAQKAAGKKQDKRECFVPSVANRSFFEQLRLHGLNLSEAVNRCIHRSMPEVIDKLIEEKKRSLLNLETHLRSLSTRKPDFKINLLQKEQRNGHA